MGFHAFFKQNLWNTFFSVWFFGGVIWHVEHGHALWRTITSLVCVLFFSYRTGYVFRKNQDDWIKELVR